VRVSKWSGRAPTPVLATPFLERHAVSPLRKLRANAASASLIAWAPSATRILVLRPLAARRESLLRRVFSKASSRRFRISVWSQKPMIRLIKIRVVGEMKRPPDRCGGLRKVREPTVLRRLTTRRTKARRPVADNRRGAAQRGGIVHRASFVDKSNTRNSITRRLALSKVRSGRFRSFGIARCRARAVSSVGERFLDTEEVTCSIHVPPTIRNPHF
jgi:hypothetical protein